METLYEITKGERIARLTTNDESARLIAALESVAGELGWQPGSQMRDWQSRATHLAVASRGEIAGGLQLVGAADGLPLPFWSFWPELKDPCRSDIAHVTVMALRKEYRGSKGLFWPLCVELWRWCEANGIREIWHEVTPGTLRLYQRLGWPLEVAGELRTHWGEECYLCKMEVSKVAGMMVIRAIRSKSYQSIVDMMSRPIGTARAVAPGAYI